MSIVTQPFEYFVVLDFEATCDRGKAPGPQEIIEYPSVLLSGETFDVINEFRSFVRPLHNPRLTPFCLELTGITQQQVDQARLFPDVLADHLAWLRGNNLRVTSQGSGANFAFISCGDWDLLKMFPSQCRACLPPVGDIPHAFSRWVNIKKHFAAWRGVTKVPGMAGMLRKLGLELTGRHHSGIDDCRNIAKIARYLAKNGVTLTATSEQSSGADG
ncbi:MAG: exonuclease domain-containing protein [Phycisphaerales bacterium]|jgi:inhibitor of KinA sporulation pathway (predicted exonuclease)|nr:exonuclease domain-containing protein [Phycisphaerales bacterium]